MKKLFSILIITVILITSFSSCAKEPSLDDYKDEMVTLIEASYEINEIFFGEGLPTYERGGELDAKHHIYDDSEQYMAYEYVIQNEKYLFVEQIKWAAEKVYTAEYLDDIYTMAFDGYADENTGAVTTARYIDVNSWIMKYSYGDTDPFNILPGNRCYDFDTVEIVKPYSKTYISITIDSYLEGEGEILPVTLRFKRTENGLRLDTPTY